MSDTRSAVDAKDGASFSGGLGRSGRSRAWGNTSENSSAASVRLEYPDDRQRLMTSGLPNRAVAPDSDHIAVRSTVNVRISESNRLSRNWSAEHVDLREQGFITTEVIPDRCGTVPAYDSTASRRHDGCHVSSGSTVKQCASGRRPRHTG